MPRVGDTALPVAITGDVSPWGQQTWARAQLCCWLAEGLCGTEVVPHEQGAGGKTTTGFQAVSLRPTDVSHRGAG